MEICFDIIMHTKKLLHGGIFNHFSDDTVSALHHLIMKSSRTNINRNIFFNVWRKGNFSNEFQHLQLLQETNFILQKNGQNTIEENFLEIELI